MNYRIDIDMDKKCKRCGKAGAVNGDWCLKCINKGLKEDKFDHLLKRNKDKART